VLGDGRNTQPLNVTHASAANEGQVIGQTPQGGSPSPATRCGSCGGPSNGEELCPACQQVFGAMLRKAAPAPAQRASTAAAVPAPAPAPVAPGPVAPLLTQAAIAPRPYNPLQAAPPSAPAIAPAASAPPAQAPAAPAAEPGATRVDPELWAQLMGTPAPPPMESFDLPAAPVPPAAVPPPPPPLPPPPVAPGQTGPTEAAIRAAQIAAAQAAKAEPIKLEAPKPGSAIAHPAAGTAAKLHAAADRVVREAPITRPPEKTPSRLAALLPSTTDRIAAGVALLCLIALGGGAAWLHFRDNSAPMSVVADIVEPEQPDDVPAAAAPAAPAEPEPVQTPAPVRPQPQAPPAVRPRKPAGAAAAPAPPKPTASARPPVASTPPPATPLPSAAVPVDVPPRPRATPTGRLFQPQEVNEAPRVVRRVEPRVPSALRGHKLDEIVVVRALVSQEGQPSRVTLLRRSRAGSALDDAVLAAVNQWTFTPALKEGEPVSSWFNFAVPVSRPD
jgi:TonB family protein